MAKLSTKARDALPSSAFVFPKDRRYPIHNASHARNALARAAGKPEEAQVRSAVKAKYPGIKVNKAVREALAEMQSDVDVTAPMWKNDAKQIVYSVVLSPGVRDSQGDIASAEEIEKAAHGFLVKYRKHDVQHSERAIEAATVESYVAPVDFEMEAPDGSTHKVLKGAWVMGIHIADRATWDRCSKADHPEPLTGVSIGGTGVRIPEAA